MLYPFTWRNRKHPGKRKTRDVKSRATRRTSSRPRLEVLEDRCLLATVTWDGGSTVDGNWMTAANWAGDIRPNPGDDLIFPASAQRLASVNDFPAGTSFRSLEFTGAGYTLSGNLLSIGPTPSPSSIRMNVPTGASAVSNTISAPIRLGSGIEVTSLFPGSTLTLIGAVDTNGNSLAVTGSGAVTISGVISGAGSVVKTGIGTLTLTGNNSYTGQTTVNGGIISVGHDNALGASGAGQGTVVNSGATLQQAPGSITTIPEPLTLNGHGVQGGLTHATLGTLSGVFGHVNWAGPITLGSDVTVTSSGATFLNITGAIDLGPHTLTINCYFPSSIGIAGVISGSGNLVINGSLAEHTVTLTAANTYTGSTAIHGGTLNLASNGTLASTQIAVNQFGTLQLDNGGTNLTDRIPDTATISLRGGAISLLGNNGIAGAGAPSSERVGIIALDRGHSTIRTTVPSGAAATVELTAETLRRVPGATVNFAGNNLGTAPNRIRFNTFPATEGASSVDGTGIWAFATFANAGFATCDAAEGVREFTGYVDSFVGAGPGDTVRLLNVSENVTADRTINALFLTSSGGGSNVTIVFSATLTLASGGLAMHTSSGVATPTIRQPVTAAGGTLAFTGEGTIFSNVGIFSDSITTRIATTRGITIGGTSTLVLNPGSGGNPYSGGTTLNSGGLSIPVGAVNPLGAPDNFFLWYGGALSSSGFGTLTLDNRILFNNSRVRLDGIPAISLRGPVTLTDRNAISGGPFGPLTLSGPISGSGSLHKFSDGPVVLGGSNIYGGGSAVSANSLTVNGSQPTVPVTLIGGTLTGTGEVGQITHLTGGNTDPGGVSTPGATRGILTIAGADFSRGGSLRIEVAGLATPGVNYDRLNLGSGTLTVGGSSRLTVDLFGLNATGRANGVVLYGNRSGTIPVFNQIEVANNSNNFLVVPEYTANALNLIISGSPVVTAVTPTASGVTVQLSRPFDPARLNLYDDQTGALGPADVTLVGPNGPVRGSLVIDSTNTRVTFVATGGVLPPGTYTLTLRSAANGFVHTSGELLDGNQDGTPGDDFVRTFTVAASSAVVVSTRDFTRGPGQPVNIPADGMGLPLRLSEANGVTSVSVTLRYNPSLLTITDATPAPGTPIGSSATLNATTPGVAVVTFDSPVALDSGARNFVTLTASVPADAIYASKQVLDLSDVRINNGAIPAQDDDAIHVAAFFGDTTGNGTYSATDATRALRVAVGLDSGFIAYQLADPVIVADINDSDSITATDATRIIQEAIGLDRPEIAPLPPDPPMIPANGPDPLLSLPKTLRARRRSTIVVPVNLDISEGLESGDLALSYDPRLLEVVSIQRGRLTRDFDLFAVNHDAGAGLIRVGLGRSTGPLTGRGSGSVLRITFRIRSDAPAGRAIVNLRERVDQTQTQLNEGGLVLNPVPSDEAGDVLDGVVTIQGRVPARRDASPIGPGLIDAFFAGAGRKDRTRGLLR